MNNIFLKELKLINFKAFRNQTFNFDQYTKIEGRNGLGKSTIFDAFTWLLFGKNREDKKVFSIKTLDEKGNIIPKLPHEVSAVILCNGEEIKLTRRLEEKWVRRRGDDHATFDGNIEERLYNDIPLKVKDWNDKINNLCSEEIFKYITNPWCFTSQKPEVQKQLLCMMAEEVDETELINTMPQFKKILDNLSGKTIQEYIETVRAKKRTLKEQAEQIQPRIDERKRDIDENVYDWATLESDLKQYTQELEQFNNKKNEPKAYEQLLTQLRTIQKDIDHKCHTIEQDAQEKLYQRETKQKEFEYQIASLNNKKDLAQRNLDNKKSLLSNLQEQRNNLLQEYNDISKSELQLNDSDFVCPTCHRPLEIDTIEQQKKQMEINFENQKKEKIQNNVQRGKAVKQDIEETNKNINLLEEEIKECTQQIEHVRKEQDKFIEQQQQDNTTDATARIIADPEIKRLREMEINLEKEIKILQNMEDNEQQQIEKEKQLSLLDKIDQTRATLAKREIITANHQRIKELEDAFKKCNEQLAELERDEYIIEQYNRKKMEQMEENINKLFSIVKFKLFKEQINGGIAETCEATVNGVPYSDINDAKKVAAGLDIINALSQYFKVKAPIFIDNAEGINVLPKTNAQLISLHVTLDEKLIITTQNK